MSTPSATRRPNDWMGTMPVSIEPRWKNGRLAEVATSDDMRAGAYRIAALL